MRADPQLRPSPPFCAAHDLSYASAAETRGGRVVIRALENATGRLHLMRRARGVEHEITPGCTVFDALVDRYGLSLNIVGGAIDYIGKSGPVIVIANHPYGILDGMMMGHLLGQRRPDFRIMANAVFAGSPDIQDMLLPIDFNDTKQALAGNLETRRAALAHLDQGGCIGVFPGGTVSTGARPFARPMDPAWRNFTARLIAKSDAVVVPVYFDGKTSKLFQLVSHLHATLRHGLLLKEFRARVDSPVNVAIGRPLGRDVLDPLAKDGKAMMDFLRKATYELAPEPLDSFDAGYDFEDRRRRR
ncbi:lysophospholipid acyltransferase family protein [Sulfitobacter sp. S190]|uniref:lysophospholipid acyltransferase family protein n=1 Tax=Sulfitobacter sp. S190 TaxID=2867022 RepID=UPI0021A2A8F1|nr:lysophospholipid acyltransferase family protein [Sulfitobacter sp. S190]UWR23747.1 lysophospholipid acyltransferase family protein [Sulfitobacter sp. S190]